MALPQWINIQKSKEQFIFCNPVGRYFAMYYSGEIWS